jgi:hypothetical protein
VFTSSALIEELTEKATGKISSVAAGFCEHGNEHSDSMKAGNFLTG